MSKTPLFDVLRTALPEPILPAHPDWVELYWRAWELMAKDIRPGAAINDFASASLDAVFLQDIRPRDTTIWDFWRAGEIDAAREAAARHLESLAAIYKQRGTLEENGTPETLQRISAGRMELSLIVLLTRVILGIETDPARQVVRWQLREPPPCGLRRLRLGQNIVSLVAQGNTGGGLVVEVEAVHTFLLEIETPFSTFVENMPAGSSHLLLTHLDRTDVRTTG